MADMAQKIARKRSKKNFIAGAIKEPGALHRQLGVPESQTIPPGKLQAAAQAGGKLGQRARFAQTLKGFSKPKPKRKAA